MTIDEKIKHLRKERNLTQRELAAALFVTNPTISNIESGKKMPSTSLVVSLSEVFGCTTDEILKNNT